MTFESFITTELPLRPALLTETLTGETGNPNSVVGNVLVNNATIGTFFLDAVSGDLWQKLDITSTSWEKVGNSTNIVVATLAERDAILTAAPGVLSEGTIINVLSLPYIYELGSGGTNADWGIFLTGNFDPVFIAEMNNPVSGAIRYIDAAAGDDEDDGLTPGTAWQTVVRGLDEIPDSSDIGTLFGSFYELRLIGVGPYKLPKTFSRPSVHSLLVTIQGDTTTAPLESFTMPAGARPVHPEQPTQTKQAVFEYNVGAYTTVLDERLHWAVAIDNYGGPDFYTTKMIDGVGSSNVGGTLRVVTGFDNNNGKTFEIRPYTTVLEGNASATELRTTVHPLGPFGVTFSIGGVKTDTGVTTVFDGVNSLAVRYQGTYVAIHECGRGIVTDNVFRARKIGYYGESGVVGGIFRSQLIWEGGSGFLQLVISRFSTTGAQINVGNPGNTPDRSNIEMSAVDFEGQTGNETGLELERFAQVRVGVFTAVTNENMNKAFSVKSSSALEIVSGRWYGNVKTPSTVNENSRVKGLLALDTTSGALTNTVTPGDDVIAGGDPTIHDWADMPKTDIGMGDLSELVSIY